MFAGGGISSFVRTVCPVSLVLLLGVPAAGVGFAEPGIDKAQTMQSPEGWEISIAKTEETLDAVPPLNAAAFSREAFLSVTASATIGGQGTTPVRAGVIAAGVMIGCNTDVSPGLTLGLNANLGANLGASGNGTLSQSPAGTAGLNGGANAGLGGNVQVTLRPGSITTVTLASKPIAAATGDLALKGVALHVDACIGQVAMRTIASFTVSTATRDDSVTVYGEPQSF
ncbi:hypothetical protein F5X71_08315 [Nocardia brasiliensis]|uniref:MspA n=1 Tax=Nocardia brasiliensis TaxID=37326 RepID=A0A6G9XN34_NOCBR|nr:hypothetical protein F5X71_08315 [Nocardia brasiliensis]